MTVIRRILIGVVGLLLLLNVGALGLVKLSAGPKPSEEKSKVVIWIDDKAQAEAAVAKLKELEYESILKPAQRADFVDANFRVVLTGSSKKMLEPVANVLRKGGHSGLSFNEDGTLLYYGGVYPTKAKAKAIVRSLKDKELIVFEVKPGQKKIMRPSYRIILMEVPENMISTVTGPLEDDDSIDVEKTEEFPLNPAADTEVEEDEVEEEDEEE